MNKRQPQHEMEDLTIIKGIGQARQRWLREQLNVRTMGDLAALTSDEIEALLRAEGRIIGRGEIQAWLEEARAFATARTQPAPKDAPSTPVASEWQPVASFVIEFQTRTLASGDICYRTTAHHMEADVGQVWDEVVPAALCDWMEAQLGERRPAIARAPANALPAPTPTPQPAASEMMAAFFSTPIENAPFTDRLRDLVGRSNVMATHEPPARPMPMPAASQQVSAPPSAGPGAFSRRMNDLLAKYGR
jgi:hypothetical protein